jgi:Tol biopolymer transport system component
MLRALAMSCLFGCGRVAFDAIDPDAATERAWDAAPSPPPSGACDPTAPFGAPVPIAELASSARDGTLRLMPDELSGYFWSYRNGGQGDLFFAARADLQSPFMVSTVTGINTSTNEIDPTISSDGTLLLFRKSSPGDDLWMATTSPATPTQFTAVSPIAVLNSPSSDAQPFLQPGGNEVIFTSSRTGNGDLYRTFRTGTAFSPPTQIGELASAFEEGDPVLTADGKTLFFRSTRPAPLLDHNIYVATRSSIADPFGTPALVENVSSDREDGASAVSADGCRLYLSSDRAGTNDIYVATRGRL